MSETHVGRWCAVLREQVDRVAGPGQGGAPGARPGVPWVSSLVVGVIQVVGSTFAAQNQPDRLHLSAFGYLLLVLGPVLLLLRRRHPVAVSTGTVAVALVYLVTGFPFGPVFLSPVVAFFAAVTAGHRRPAWAALGALYATHLLVGHWLYRWLPGGGATSWRAEAGVAAWLLVIIAVTELARLRREQVAQARLTREQAERRRADEERLRIARELHDILAHSISVINVQAGVALALLDDHPEQARSALATIKSASKEALGEVRHVLDALRTPGGTAPRAPAPGLDRLPELAEQAAAAGLRVGLDTRGEATALPPGTDLAAFRIVQEALTNVIRHSGSRTARVLIEYGPDRLDLLVDDDGPATATGESGGGNGLVGMRERAAALGGSVEAGPRGDGGFRVRARLPLAGAGQATTARTARTAHTEERR
jgi:signal transduction histidine kinase